MGKLRAIRWKEGSRVKCDAEVAYNFLEEVRRDCGGVVDIDEAVRRSEPEDAPLHNDLEWDDSKCGVAYRQSQMKEITRKIIVQRVDMPVPTRAYQSVTVIDTTAPEKPVERNVYRKTEDILADPVARTDLLQRAVREALAFKKRYQALSELAGIIRVIDEEVGRLA